MKAVEKLPTLSITYLALNRMRRTGLLDKLSSTPVDNQTACRLAKILKPLKAQIVAVEKEYIEEIQAPHIARMKDAGYDMDNKPDPKTVSPEVLEKLKKLDQELSKAQDIFGTRTFEIEAMPLGPQHLKDIKLSVDDLENLGPLFDESGAVRTKAAQMSLGLVPEVPNQ